MMDISDMTGQLKIMRLFSPLLCWQNSTLYFANQTNSDYRIPLATVNLPDYRQSPKCVSCQ